MVSTRNRDKLKRLISRYSPELETQYKAYRNHLNKLIKIAKSSFYKRKIEENRGDLKKIYQIISDATSENREPKNKDFKIVDEAGNDFLGNKSMANYCNQYLIDIGINMQNKVADSQNPFLIKNHNLKTIFLKPVTENEIISHISSLRNDCSPGKDGITVRIIKAAHDNIISPLKHIINLIFITGRVPSFFKQSVVTLLHKKGSRSEIENFRPISLINNFAKIFEKCLKNRLLDFLKINHVLADNQFGFTEGSGTADAIYHLTSEVVGNLNNSKKSLAVFIDLARAFDTVSHQKLLEVLSSYGVRGISLDVFEDYLRDRRQYLKINGVYSDPRSVRIGVPQGSILGPILFVIYINSLLGADIGGKVISYADDTVLIFSDDTWQGTRDKTIEGFNIVKDWLATFKLSLNLDKTNYMAFSLTEANRPNFNSIMVDTGTQESIHGVEKTKYLGIILDQNLKWTHHIDYITGKLKGLIHKFYLLREFLSNRLMILIYKSLVESILRYGIIVWGGTYKTNLLSLKIIQNYLLKVIYGKSRLFPTRLLYSDDICNITSLYIQSVCAFVHKSKFLKHYIEHTYETRNRINKHLVIPVNHKQVNLKFFDYLAPKFYNLLPGEVKSIAGMKSFNRKSKAFIFENYEEFARILQ